MQCEAVRGIQHVYADTAEMRAGSSANVFTRFTLSFSVFSVISMLAEVTSVRTDSLQLRSRQGCRNCIFRGLHDDNGRAITEVTRANPSGIAEMSGLNFDRKDKKFRVPTETSRTGGGGQERRAVCSDGSVFALQDCRQRFRAVLVEATLKLDEQVKRIGRAVDDSKPYWEARKAARQVHTRAHVLWREPAAAPEVVRQQV